MPTEGELHPAVNSAKKVASQIERPISGMAPAGEKLGPWSLVVAANDSRVLKTTLLASPALDSRCQIIVKEGFRSAGSAYNAGLAEARNEIVVFAHQDIFLPSEWTADIGRALSHLAVADPNWGALGLVGVEKVFPGRIAGFCYSTGLQSFVGKPFCAPIEVSSLDEIVLVLRRSSGLKFDVNLPGFHLFGTDICMEAERRGMKCYAASAFCIHNTNGIKRLPAAFWRAYLYLRCKWQDRLPIRTCCTTITKWGAPAIYQIARDSSRAFLKLPRVGSRWQNVDNLLRLVEQERSKCSWL